MKRNYFVPLIAVVLTLALMPAVNADTRLNIDIGHPQHTDLDVFVWPDRGIDAVYFPGDPIRVFFEVTRDCYVVIYDIDTRGRLHILFPFDPWQDNFVEAGRVYELPGDWDDFQLSVDGPSGVEYIQAVASPYPFDMPDWPIYINSPGYYPTTCEDPELMDFRAGDDRISYIHRVNRKISRHRWDWCATDLARFYVHRQPPTFYRGWPYRISIDPFPDVIYGEIYVGWPIGTHIYVDGIFYGIAPCWVRGVSFGHHLIRCYDGHRIVFEKNVRYQHKRAYRKDHPDYRIRGRSTATPFRTAPGVSVSRVEKSRTSGSPGKYDRRSGVSEKQRTSGVGDKTAVRRPAQKSGSAEESYKPAERTRKPGREVTVAPPAKREKAKEANGLKKVLSALGGVVADNAAKVEKKKKSTAQSGVKNSTAEKKTKSAERSKSKPQRRSGSKKR